MLLIPRVLPIDVTHAHPVKVTHLLHIITTHAWQRLVVGRSQQCLTSWSMLLVKRVPVVVITHVQQ